MPIKIFFCYAHEDETLLKKLKAQLRPLRWLGLIDMWQDRNISAGAEWEKEISVQLNEAQVILLLVSPDFMDSDYCYSIEMKRAMERHEAGDVRVIPIILRHCLWKRSPFGKLQVLPGDGKPIMSSSWHNLDEAFFNVAEELDKTIEELVATTSIDARLEQSLNNYKEAVLDIANEQNRSNSPLLGQKVLQWLKASKTLFSAKSEAASINLAKREINCKLVYYGIGSSGKSANLHYIHQTVSPQDVGDMVSIDTETERTLYFDLLPLTLGKVHGFQIRFQLYTVPGQMLYQQTRVSVLKRANSVIFVADSQASKLQENIECWNELQEWFQRMNKDITTFPLIMQWNNRKQPDILPVAILERYLNPYHFPSFEADAETGVGVIECLRAAIDKTLMSI